MRRCSILVPTHRDSPKVRATLDYLAHACTDVVGLVIADNSTQPAKHDYLRALADRYPGVDIYLHETNIGGARNLLFMLEKSAESEFVGLCSDDDMLTRDFIETSYAMLSESPEASGAAGHLVALHSNGTSSCEAQPILGATATERMARWFNPSSFNLVLYALLRRRHLQPWVDFNRDHPMRSAFFDFLLTTSAAVRGPLVRHARGAYIWSADNWDSPARNFASRSRWYRELGLPETFAMFFDLHFAVEQAVFLLGRYSPVERAEERPTCAEVAWKRCVERFRQAVAAEEAAYVDAVGGNERAIAALRGFYHHQGCPSREVIARFPELLEAFSESLAESYKRHLERVLPPEAAMP